MSEVEESLDAIFKALRSLNPNPAYLIHLDDLQEEFANSRTAADAASKAGKLDETEKANYAKAAKALPDVAKGLKAAIIAFEKGDAMEGSAAIMDICSTVATVLGTMAAASSAAGPIGAFMGAVFGIVGMILRSFQDKQKDLGDVLEGKLRLVGAENVRIGLSTAIDEFETLRAGYPDKGPVKIKASMLNALSEGNATDHLLVSANWLLMDGNIKEPTITASWLNALAAYLHANCLQLRNLTHLLSIASADDYPNLDRTYKQIAKVHLSKMQQLHAPARSMGMVWHIGLPTGVGNAGGVGGIAYGGGHIYKRQGADYSSAWMSLGGKQQNFAMAKDPTGDGRHVVALEGAREGLELARGFSPDTLKWVPFHHHKRAYIKSIAGEWPAAGTAWKQLSGLDGCRDLVAIPGDEAGEVYVFAVQNNAVVSHKVTRKESNVTVSANLEKTSADADVTLLSIRVMPGYRPAGTKSSPPSALPYVLRERIVKFSIVPTLPLDILSQNPALPAVFVPQVERIYEIQCGLASDWVLKAPWDTVSGIAIDDDHLWIWKSDAIACVSHMQIKQILDKQISPDGAWVCHKINSTVLDKSPGRSRLYEEGRAGLTYLAPSDDGTLMVIFNARLYTGTPVANQSDDTFDIVWKANDPKTRLSRVLKERIECWSLFAQHLSMLEDIAQDRKPHWDPTMRPRALS